MEKATAVNTCLGVLKGRDCIYLDQVKQDDLNNLTFIGDINGHLISQHRDEKDWFPYTLTFLSHFFATSAAPSANPLTIPSTSAFLSFGTFSRTPISSLESSFFFLISLDSDRKSVV